MNITEIRAEVERLREIHGLSPIKVAINKRLTSKAGRNNWIKRQIDIAAWLLQAPDAAILDTVRHEFAHQLDWDSGDKTRRLKHDTRWQLLAIECGADPSPYYADSLLEYAPSKSGRRYRDLAVRIDRVVSKRDQLIATNLAEMRSR